MRRDTKLQSLDWLRHNGLFMTKADAWKAEVRAAREATDMKRFASEVLKLLK